MTNTDVANLGYYKSFFIPVDEVLILFSKETSLKIIFRFFTKLVHSDI